MMQSGIYNMSFEDYKKIDAINNSKLVRASKTLAHALYEKEDTAVMNLGRDFHTYLLELGRFKKEYAVCLLYTSPSPRDRTRSRMPSSA